MAIKALTPQQLVSAYMSKFAFKFTINKDFIDFGEMSKNFPNEQIPTLEIAKAVEVLLGKAPKPANSIDPRPKGWVNPTVESCAGKYDEPQFAYVEFTELSLITSCNRDICPRHVARIEKSFRKDTVAVLCCIKNPIDGTYFIWEGDHTTIVLQRQGYTHARIIYIQADPNDTRDPKIILQELLLKAAHSFICINGSGRKKMDHYDLHLIKLRAKDPDACGMQKILDDNKVTLVRNRKYKSDGSVGHVQSVEEVYFKTNRGSVPTGVILDRALKLIRTNFPKQPVNTYLLTALGHIYEAGIREQSPVPLVWDKEIGPILRNYSNGSANEMFNNFLGTHFLHKHGDPSDKRAMVSEGILQLYAKETGRIPPVPTDAKWLTTKYVSSETV